MPTKISSPGSSREKIACSISQADPFESRALLVAFAQCGNRCMGTDLQTGDNTWDEGVAELVGIPIGQEGDEGKRWTESIHPEDRKAVLASFRCAGEQGIPLERRLSCGVCGRSHQWFNARSIVATVQDGRRKMVGVVQDINECNRRKRRWP